MEEDLEGARVGYEAYAKTTGGLTYDGREMPKFDALPPRIKTAWAAATDAAYEFIKARG